MSDVGRDGTLTNGDEYTPTTEAMRERLVEFSYEFSGVPRAETSAEFDRWLAGVVADAKTDALEGLAQMWENSARDNSYAMDDEDRSEIKAYCAAVRAYSTNTYPKGVRSQ